MIAYLAYLTASPVYLVVHPLAYLTASLSVSRTASPAYLALHPSAYLAVHPSAYLAVHLLRTSPRTSHVPPTHLPTYLLDTLLLPALEAYQHSAQATYLGARNAEA